MKNFGESFPQNNEGELKEAKEGLRGDIESAEGLLAKFKSGVDKFDAEQVRALRTAIAGLFEANRDNVTGSGE